MRPAESIFGLHDLAHGVKVGLQIFKFDLVLKLNLLDNFIELALRSADLLGNPTGTVLQVTTDVTHRLSPDLSSAQLQERPRGAVVPAGSLQP
jgi:hypothetical protein